MKNLRIYICPFMLSIVVGLSLFVSRHSFAEKGMSVALVGAVSIIYGVGYLFASAFMGRIIKPVHARRQMLIASLLLSVILSVLANVHGPVLVLSVFAMLPLVANLFVNAFQAYMRDFGATSDISLSHSAGNYTFAWSLGLAAGPLVSTLVKNAASWSAAYYVAGAITIGLAISVLSFRQNGTVQNESDAQNRDLPETGPALYHSGWMGVFVCLSAILCITTFWPVQSEALGFTAGVKGLVESTMSVSQAITALIVCRFRNLYHRPAFLPLVALPGICGVAVFAFATGPMGFVAGSACIGMFSGFCFTYVVYHALLDKKHSVKRVALNELVVGFCCIIGPLLARSFSAGNGAFTAGYLRLMAFIAIGVALQWLLAVKQSRSMAQC